MANLLNYIFQEKPVQQMIEPNILINSLATIHEGNKETLQKESELREAIAQLDLNEAEDNFRNELYNDIERTIDENSFAENPYYALEDIIKKSGDIRSNPGLIGRIKAQAAYKEHRNKIDQMVQKGVINQDTADWAKELNPYSYEDTYDDKGNIIGGKTWIPNITPVKDIDLNTVYATASKYLIPKNTHWENITFINNDGTISSVWDKDKSIAILNTSTGERRDITKEMVDRAINMTINANPEIEASIKQSFDVAKWKYKNGDTEQNLAYDETGRLKSYTQYKNDLIDPYINQMIYSETQSSTKWHDSGLRLLYKQRLSAKAAGGYNNYNPYDALEIARSVTGHPIVIDKDIFGSSIGKINEGKAKLSLYAGVPIINIPDDYDSYVQLINNKTNLSNEDKNLYLKDAKDFYDMYSEQIKNNRNRANSDSELHAATIVQQYLDNNIPLNQIQGRNPHIKQYIDMYNDYINNMFKGKEYIKFVPKNFNKLIQSNDDINRLESLGIKVYNNSLILSKDNDNILYAFMRFINGQDGDIYRGNNITDDDWMQLNTGTPLEVPRDGSVSLTNIGNDRRVLNKEDVFDYIHPSTQSYINSSFNIQEKLNSVYRQNAVDEYKKDEGNIIIGTSGLGSFTIGDLVAKQILEETGDSKVKAMQNSAKEHVIDLVKTGNFIDTEVYQAIETDDGGYYYKLLDRGEKLRIQDEISNIDDKDITGNLSYIQGYEFKQGISYYRPLYDKNGKATHEGKSIKLIFGTNTRDKVLEDINNSDVIRAGKELMGSYVNDESINVGKYGNNYISLQGYKDENNLKFSDKFIINVNGDFYNITDTYEGINLLSSYRTLISDRSKYNYSTEEDIVNYMKNHPNIVKTYINVFGEKQGIKIITDTLMY